MESTVNTVPAVNVFFLSFPFYQERSPKLLANHGLYFLFLELKYLWYISHYPVTKGLILSFSCFFSFLLLFLTGLLTGPVSRASWTCYLLDLQAVAPYPFQQVTEAGNQGVLLQASYVCFSMAQFHCFVSHLLHQHAFRLKISHAVSRVIPAMRPKTIKSIPEWGHLGSLHYISNCRFGITVGKVS